MPEFSFLSVLILGFFLGLKHATEADHIAAVTTLVAGEKRVRQGFAIGALWGLGHTFSLSAAGVLVVLFRVPISDRLAAYLELSVAVMLVVLGIRHIRPRHSHAHDHAGWIGFGLRPLAVGAIHGAAGSAALTLVALSTIPSTIPSSGAAVLYIVIFGIGSIFGMAGLTALMSLPLYFARERILAGFGRIQLAAGLASCLFGLYLISTHFF